MNFFKAARQWQINKALAIAIGALLFSVSMAKGGNDFKASFGLLSPEERESALSSYVDLKIPEGLGSFPLAIILPGCMGWHPHHSKWQERLLRLQIAVLHLDSFAARGIVNPLELKRDVCGGKQALGDERAGDLVSVLGTVWANPKIQAQNTLIMGWSHGGWTALDLLVILKSRIKPPNLTSLPLLDVTNFRSAILYYPYCGQASLNWRGELPTGLNGFLFHGSRDQITSPRECERRIRRLSDRGGKLEFVSLKNAGHWFDNHTSGMFSKKANNQSFSAANGIIESLGTVKTIVRPNGYGGDNKTTSGDSLMDLFESVNDP